MLRNQDRKDTNEYVTLEKLLAEKTKRRKLSKLYS